ncbi:MAG: hypothetical protein ABL884_00715 [Methyloglobulus sp.]
MTTHAQINKLYPKLDNGQLAALAFDALMRGDDNGRMAIVSSVDRRYYHCINQGFTKSYNGYIDLGLFYGTVYWKARACMAVMDGKFKESGNEADQQAALVFVDRVLAMETALMDVCAKANIDVLAVKKLALCEDEYSPDKCNNEELVGEYVGLFMGIVG